MAKKGKKWYKKNEKSHCFLIKVTFCKKIELCVCRTRFKNPFLQTFEKGGEAKKSFPFTFLFSK